ncbi:MAG TPA: PadR family transcriptional regulator [Ktedonobacteraceae bacterium]|nr:PadR family transcriptional regulator [Ktedonobacteraceae bacterium]
MSSDDPQANASWPLEEKASSRQGRPLTRGMRPLIYELFVLGELLVQPMSGSFLHETARRILGPFRPLSWGIISPLLRRLEQQGMVTSVTEQRRAGLPSSGRGQPPRLYTITPAGRERFLSLLLTPSAYSRDTPEEFVIKLTKFQFLTPAQRVTVLQWYRSYQDILRSSYQEARDYVRHNPEITDGERAWIMRSIEYRLHRVQAERSWLDQQIAGEQREQDADPPMMEE